jgi:trehalose utilization protein
MRLPATLILLSLACHSGGPAPRPRDAMAPGVAGPDAAAPDKGVAADAAAPVDAAATAKDAPADRGAPEVVDARPIARDAAGPDAAPAAGGAFRMLILSKTLEYHHDSIPACQQMLRELGATPDANLPAGAQPGSQWEVTVANEDLSEFTDQGLGRYAMIFWCSPTGTVFSSGGPSGVTGMAAVQKFLTSGGAWGGVHSATDFENTHAWSWFQDNVNGANFANHDGDGTPNSIVWSVALDHPVVRGIKSPWSTTDEWYYLTRNPETLPGFTVLGKLASDQRPAVYVREIPGGGRSFYTIRGHNVTVYAEPNFRRLVHQGVLWAVHRMK